MKAHVVESNGDVALGHGYLNKEFVITSITSAGASILRRRQDEVVGRPLDTLLQEANAAGEPIAADPSALGQEYILHTSGNEKIWLRLFVIPAAPEGTSNSIFVVEDVTAIKQCKVQKDSFRDMDLVQKEQWHRLFRNASHDLREPLRMVCTYVGLLKAENQNELNPSGQEYLGFAHEGAARLRRQTEALLRLLSLEFQQFHRGPTSMEEALKCALHGLSERILETNASVVSDPLPEVWGNSGLLVDLLEAILDNAMKFAQTQGPAQVQVQCSIDNRLALFTISDTGSGVPQEKLEEIFDPFRRLHARDRFPGEGLGLTLSRRIVQMHGGKIWAAKTGTQFQIAFSLPLAQSGTE